MKRALAVLLVLVALVPAVFLGDLELVVGVFVDLVHLRLGDVHLDAAAKISGIAFRIVPVIPVPDILQVKVRA